MAGTLANLLVKLGVDVSQFESGLQGANQRLKKFGTEMMSTGKKLSFGLSLPILSVGAATIKFASDLDEARNKASVVFGDGIDLVTKFSNTSADAYGIARAEALEYAATLGQVLKASGTTGEATAGFAVELLKLSADIASFNNIEIDEALLKLRAGLLGESEPLRTVGVLLSEAAVEQKAFQLGIANTKKEMTDAIKIQARYAIIMDQTADTQGDFTRTADGLANSQRRLTASTVTLAGDLGQKLLPFALRLVKVGQDLVRGLGGLSDSQVDWAIGLGIVSAALGPVLFSIGALARLVAGAIVAVGKLKGVFLLIYGIFRQAPGPVGVVLTAVGALSLAGYELVKNWRVIVGLTWKKVWAGIVGSTQKAVASVLRTIATLFSYIAEVDIFGFYSQAVTDLETAADRLDLNAEINFEYVMDVTEMENSAADVLAKAMSAVPGAGAGGGGKKDGASGGAKAMSDFKKASDGLAADLAAIDKLVSVLGPTFDATSAKVSATQSALDAMAKTAEGTPEALQPIAEDLQRLQKAAFLEDVARDFQNLELEASLLGDTTGLTAAQAEAAKSAYTRAAETFGMTSDVTQQLAADFAELNAQARTEGVSSALSNINKELAVNSGTASAFGLSGKEALSLDSASVLSGIESALRESKGVITPEIRLEIKNLDKLNSAISTIETIESVTERVGGSITSAFSSSIQGIIQGTTTLQEAWANMAQSLVLSIVDMGIQMIASWLVTQAQMLLINAATKAGIISTDATAAAASSGFGWMAAAGWVGGALMAGISWIGALGTIIAGNVVAAASVLASAISAAWGWIMVAATAAASAVASIPIVGPALAIAAAGAVIGGLAALVMHIAGASRGAAIQEDQLLYVHKGEMVLPPKLSSGIKGVIENENTGGLGGSSIAGTPRVSTATGGLLGAHVASPSLRDILADEASLGGRGGSAVFSPSIQALDASGVDRVLEKHGKRFMEMAADRRRAFDPSTRRRSRTARGRI